MKGPLGALLLGAGASLFLLGTLWPTSAPTPSRPTARPKTVTTTRTRLVREVVIVISPGESSQTVAQNLQEAGVVPNAARFLQNAGQAAWHFHAGVFRFRLPVGEGQILKKLTAP